jgi:hypothetical protein
MSGLNTQTASLPTIYTSTTKSMASRVGVLLSLILFLVSCQVCSATGLVINEFVPKPEDDVAEWIELYNQSSVSLNLTGFVLDDREGGTAPFKLDGYHVDAGGFVVIEKSVSGIGLNNAGDEVRLLDNTGNLIDTYAYARTETGLSYARVPDGSDNWVVGNPTKGTPNSLTSTGTPTTAITPLPTTGNVTFSEIMSCSDEVSTEWIELHNHESTSLDLSSWLIIDAAGNKVPLSGTIKPASYLVINLEKSIINNTGDTLLLQNPSGHAVSQADLPSCQQNTSFIMQGSKWLITTSKTPGVANQLVQPTTNQGRTEVQASPTIGNTELPIMRESGISHNNSGRPDIPTSSLLDLSAINASVAGIVDVSTPSAIIIASPSAVSYNHPQAEAVIIPLITGVSFSLFAGYGLYSHTKNATNG